MKKNLVLALSCATMVALPSIASADAAKFEIGGYIQNTSPETGDSANGLLIDAKYVSDYSVFVEGDYQSTGFDGYDQSMYRVGAGYRFQLTDNFILDPSAGYLSETLSSDDADLDSTGWYAKILARYHVNNSLNIDASVLRGDGDNWDSNPIEWKLNADYYLTNNFGLSAGYKYLSDSGFDYQAYAGLKLRF